MVFGSSKPDKDCISNITDGLQLILQAFLSIVHFFVLTTTVVDLFALKMAESLDYDIKKTTVPNVDQVVEEGTTEKIQPVVTNEATNLETLKLKSDDEAAALAIEAFSAGPIDQEKAKKVLRKINTYILPILCLTYGNTMKNEMD